MDQRPLVEGHIANFGISLDVFEFLRFGCFFPFFKKNGFLGILGPPGNHASRWIKDLWSKGILLILAYFQTFLSFCVLDDFCRFQKKNRFRGILGPPSYGIGATICIGREMLCLSYAGFFYWMSQHRPYHRIIENSEQILFGPTSWFRRGSLKWYQHNSDIA